ncbi:hypothetical protein BKA57DRAFT_471822 [Linnemannia elongata]|nr:hypothetical protein BKA57DRAFT_471822 [Linnemannia elongata]
MRATDCLIWFCICVSMSECGGEGQRERGCGQVKRERERQRERREGGCRWCVQGWCVEERDMRGKEESDDRE